MSAIVAVSIVGKEGGREEGMGEGKTSDGRYVLDMFLIFACVTFSGASSGAGCSGERKRCARTLCFRCSGIVGGPY